MPRTVFNNSVIAANFVDVYITLVVIGVFSSGKKESSGIYLGFLMDHESTFNLHLINLHLITRPLYNLLIMYSVFCIDYDPANATALYTLALNATALEATALGATALNTIALNYTALDGGRYSPGRCGLDAAALYETALQDATALNAMALYATALNATTPQNAMALYATALNYTALNDPALDATALNTTALDATALQTPRPCTLRP